MKTSILILTIGLLVSACHSEKKMMDSPRGYVSTQPVDLTIRETVQDTMVIEEKPAPARPEKVVKTAGADLMHYCIIVGSFANEQNAINLRGNLIREGFLGSSIMQNDAGMYRVSIECDNSHAGAWQEVDRIRHQYPRFQDAWLLEVKN